MVSAGSAEHRGGQVRRLRRVEIPPRLRSAAGLPGRERDRRYSPSARRAGQATLSTRSGQCPSRTATFRDDLGGHASPWRGTGFACITDNVVLRTGTAAGIRPRVRFYYCPDTICLRTMTRSLRSG
ncbi:MAG: hypothetical protein ACR2MP_15895 [Streptosporangiaceae bacterium]